MTPSLAGQRVVRMNGAGNKILVLDARGGRPTPTPEEARAIHRAPGLDYDQLMALTDPRVSETLAYVLIYNNDGSLAGACGNGTRCVADRLARETGASTLAVETERGVIRCERLGERSYRVDMGAPRLGWSQIPIAQSVDDTSAVEIAEAREFGPAGLVNMGNPHAVFFVANVAAIDLERVGPGLERHPLFPQKANISFAQVLAPDRLRLRVWERGVGATLACGSAACATLVAAARRGLSGRKAAVELPGGELVIDWSAEGSVLMTGPVEFEREFELTPAILSGMNESRRLDAIDVARGLALVAMAAYHFTWDLSYFGVIAAGTPYTPPMRVASHTIGAAFLGLAGVSLALAHARGFNGRGFWRRLARIAGAAALVSAATYYVAPEAPIFFGILHCIFAGSLLAAVVLRGRGIAGGAALAAGLALVVAPWLFASPILNSPWLVWIGLGTEEPSTLDWRPLTPWAGVLLLGLAAGLLVSPPFARWRAKAAALRLASFAGRHSLAVYLVHQPILLGLLYGATELTGFNQRQSVENYLRACRPACVEAGGEIDVCERACACVVRDSASAGLSGRLGAHSLRKEERAKLEAIVEACGSEAK